MNNTPNSGGRKKTTASGSGSVRKTESINTNGPIGKKDGYSNRPGGSHSQQSGGGQRSSSSSGGLLGLLFGGGIKRLVIIVIVVLAPVAVPLTTNTIIPPVQAARQTPEVPILQAPGAPCWNFCSEVLNQMPVLLSME